MQKKLPRLKNVSSGLLGKSVEIAKMKGVRIKSSSSYDGTSTSEEEIAHFKKLAPTWWDTSGSQRILHKMNLSRLEFMRKILSNEVKISNSRIVVPGFNFKDHLPHDVGEQARKALENEVRVQLNRGKYNVLDVGCGGGILSESLARLPFIQSVHGIDLASECITVAKQHRDRDPMIKDKIVYELKPLADVDAKYELVTLFEILEHTDNPSEMLRHAWHKLKPNGILFLSTINRDFVSWFTTIFVAENILNIVPKGTHHIEKYVNSSEILHWFENNAPGSHKVLETMGTMYVPAAGWMNHKVPSIGNYIVAIKKTK
ncbi:hexaprenyldihydroxybenzoate methyltransferase Ecym_2788 [Eremothecium cymbalariae DBVPG|uniref:Ubiquinone biosynthesis O-methyltransferase, mitochondrial n=1 Tax=Eremothecium cymbalariae (strain CBS 270.75 / DBVPG 7215 / KCTC 17166 / NRRL Y-17582) TaxID=931890 RepID=G8JQ23_ERECY|nr:Hypothetical protein Ecym_2788 [Eremothecium cymbalariae DBVPG\